jgi:PD-(D/E)XK endonuclease
MKKRKNIISNKKLRGEWAEMCFMVRAAEHGLPIAKPWGEMRTYDFIVGSTGHFVSVQVKSTIFEVGTGYECTVRGGHKSYPPGSFDFLAAYAALEDSWYIIPQDAILGRGTVPLRPNSKDAPYEKYREAWHLLQGEKGTMIDRIEACAEFVPATLGSVCSSEGAVSIFACELRRFAQTAYSAWAADK